MKLALVVPEVHKHGGTEKYIAYLIEDISENNEITLFAVKCEELDVDTIKRITFFKIPGFLRPVMFAHFWFFCISSVIVGIMRIIKQFDLIVAHGPDTGWADVITAHYCHRERLMLVKEGKIIIQAKTLYDKIRKFYYFLYYRYASLFERLFYTMKNVKKLIAVSDGIKELFIKYKLVDEDKIIVVPSSIDLELFNTEHRTEYRGEIRKKYGISENEKILIFVARGEWNRKGLPLLFDALNLLDSKAKLLVVGGKESVELYENMAKEKKVKEKVIFTGFSSEVWKYYPAGDIFVYPSFFEAFALVILEAAASGLPLVSSKISGTEEFILDGQNGFFIRHNASDIAEKINLLLNNDELRERMGKEAGKTAKNYDRKEISKRILEVYESSSCIK